MHLLILIIILAAASALWKRLFGGGEKAFVKVCWSNTIAASLPLPATRAAVARHLEGRGCILIDSEGIADAFTRGDHSITNIPYSRDVSWLEVPIVLGAAFVEKNGETLVNLHFQALPMVTWSPIGVQFFMKQASIEFEGVIAHLNQVGRERAEAHEREQSRDGRRYSNDNGAQAERCDASHHADYAVLGLKPGASWVEVQAAYREACMKFHPDHLSGQNVAPHLVELAVQRFQEVTAAYRRLKERSVSSSGAR